MKSWHSPLWLGLAALLAGVLLGQDVLDPGLRRGLLAALVLLGYGSFALCFLRRPAADLTESDWLVAYGSQTGFAERLARRAASDLQAAGQRVTLLPLAQVSAAQLAGAGQALFVASTYGEGEAPDNARAFARHLLSRPLPLAHLHYGLLALGDRHYRPFCGFGHRLGDWLQAQGAQALFPLIEVDADDALALQQWEKAVATLTGMCQATHAEVPDWQRWRLVSRHHLNPDSSGNPVFHIELEAPAALAPRWAAGDIAEIRPALVPAVVDAFIAALGLDPAARVTCAGQGLSLASALAGCELPGVSAALKRLDPQALANQLKPLPARKYSLASLPEDGRIHLLVRQRHGPAGLGLGSGWLTAHAPLGAEIPVRLCPNPGFHVPAADRPLILVGNGTGVAGLRSLLKARVAAGHDRNWLLFGERHRAADFHYQNEIESWQRNGWLARLDLAFSRDQDERLYVQHRLAAAVEPLREWLAAGASVYVCGSRAGMAPGVEAVLEQVLGLDGLAALAASGRYCRDVY